MKLSPVFVVLFVIVSTIILVELPKKQRISIDIEQDYSTPECMHDECFRDTPSADELNSVMFSNR